MAIPFATVSDLEALWRPLSDPEKTRAGTLLSAASRRIRAARPGIDAAIEADEIDPELVGDIACSMVKRVMQGPADLEGVTQTQQSAGPFSQGASFANPSGNLYLTKDDKADLGIGRQQAFTVDLLASESD